jgi:phenylpyruvate tautomerase PptA (4-oxalocrotonate tautomerase family)
MPVITCENRAGLAPATKAELAARITEEVQAAIRSPLDLVSVVFHDLPRENTYRSGAPTEDTLIFCHIRAGRSDEAVQDLVARVSRAWSQVTGDPEDCIEVVAGQYPARFTFRNGQRLPEPPYV